MKKSFWLKSAFLASALVLGGVVASHVHADEGIKMYRLYNPNSSEHFYTSSVAERDHLVSVGWKNEGGAWTAPTSGRPVYRLYSKTSGDHHYTTSLAEKNNLVKVGWSYENIGWYSKGGHAVYRLFNPNAKGAGSHHYTLSRDEYHQLIALGWRGENLGWYALGDSEMSNRPIVTDSATPRKVDENITTNGGGAGDNPGSYRLLYSQKPFDQMPETQAVPFIEFSADVTMKGSQLDGDFYGLQFIVAGNGDASGQVGLDIGYQDGGSIEFAQGRLAVKTVNFPAGSGDHGQQYYSVNTAAYMDDSAKLTVQYYRLPQGEYVVTRVNDQVVGMYQTKLTTNERYILHAQIEDWQKNVATLSIRNLQVLMNGVDVTMKGAVNMQINKKPETKATSFDLRAGSDVWLIHGAY